jgi:pre-60S factor REI1
MATPQLTSTTAPGKVFASRNELADHYKSDWHKYNLKRREAGLPLLLELDFQARLAAALSLRQEDVRDGTSHLKKGKKQRQRGNGKNNNKVGVVVKSQTAAYEEIKHKGAEETDPIAMDETEDGDEAPETANAAEEAVMIDPKQCLFDRHLSASVEVNADRMYRKYGFFLPDREYLTDLEGLIGYCHEKIKLGHMWCVCFLVK